jgi:hypothetical protein
MTDGLKAGQGVGDIKPRLGGYFANMVLAGRGAEAEKVLATQIFPKLPALKTWYVAHRTALVNSTYGQPEGRLQVADSKAYPLPREEQP